MCDRDTEVETAVEHGWSTEKTLCPVRPRLHPTPAQRTIVFIAASTILMSWFVLPRRAAVAVVVKLDRPFSLHARGTNDSMDAQYTKTPLCSHLSDPLLYLSWFESHLLLICMAVDAFLVRLLNLAAHRQIFLPQSAPPAWALLIGEEKIKIPGSPFQSAMPAGYFVQDKHYQPQSSHVLTVKFEKRK